MISVICKNAKEFGIIISDISRSISFTFIWGAYSNL